MSSSFHVGRLIDHIGLVTSHFAESKRFYAAVLDALGRPLEGEREHGFWVDELYVSSAQDALSVTGLSHVHLAFQADDRAMVDAFHRAGLAAGGRDNGAPGERAYRPGYYGAFLFDPDGNNIEAVYHGPSTRSAPSVTITLHD